MIIEDLYDETMSTSSAFRIWLSLDGTDEDSYYIAESDISSEMVAAIYMDTGNCFVYREY